MQLYFQVCFCLKVIRQWHNLFTGGHGHVIRMLEYARVVRFSEYAWTCKQTGEAAKQTYMYKGFNQLTLSMR